MKNFLSDQVKECETGPRFFNLSSCKSFILIQNTNKFLLFVIIKFLWDKEITKCQKFLYPAKSILELFQDYESLKRSSQSSGRLFQDQAFPASNSLLVDSNSSTQSIFTYFGGGGISASGIEWLRPNVRFFHFLMKMSGNYRQFLFSAGDLPQPANVCGRP